MRWLDPPMSHRTAIVRICLGAAVAVALAITTIQAQIPGRNVNMVSGTKWPEGDPFLQRQNEPSVAASTRNPLHLLGGSNDYRTVDVPGLPDGEETGDAWLGLFKSIDGGQRWSSSLLPGYPQDQSPAGLASPLKNYQAGADAVVRAGTNGLIYYSGLVFDRTEDGKSGVFIARFIDNNNQEAGDPIAYLGTKLVAASSGAKFLDKPWMAVDIPRSNGATCTVTDDDILATSQNGRRRKHGYDRHEHRNDDRGRGTDRDDDRNGRSRGRGGRPSPVPPQAQRIPAGAVYVAYSSITGDGAALRSEILLTRSMDCGNTWSAPIKVSRPEDAVNQGSTLTIDPRTGAVYVAWRRFDPDLTDTNDLDAIMAARLPFGASKFDTPNRAHKFPRPTRKVGRKLHKLFEHRDNRFKDVPANEATENLDQFDLGTTGYNFRTNAYPTMAADGTGRVYIAWTQRGYAADSGPADGARIVIATTRDGRSFTAPQAVDDHATPGRGHQLMPSMAFAGGKLMLVFYDLRDSRAQTSNRIMSDFNTNTGLRQTIDIRSALASPGDNPAFAPSVRVSDYLLGFNPSSGEVEEMQVNPPNLPMFKLGTVPFMGDYIDVTAAPAFVPTGNGKWAYNTASTGQLPTFHAVWTDNRDVRPPLAGDWSNYTPAKMSPDQLPSSSIFDPSLPVPQCIDGAGNPGSRNQNVYSARITGGLLAGSPGNAKPLSPELQRGFVVFAQNTTKETRSFRMTILSQPVGGRASFDQFPLPPYTNASPAPETAIEMIVPPLSTASRTVYVTSSDANAQLNVDVTELNDLRLLASPALYPSATPKSAGLAARVVLNPDIENPDIENPDIENPDIENPDIENAEVYNPDIENPDIENPDIENPDIENPDIENPDIENPDIENQHIQNVRVANPDIENPDIENPDIENPDIENPDIENPDIENPDIENGAISDITWKVSNTGNTTASFNVNLFLAQQTLPAGLKTQLVLLKTYRTPATVANGCQLGFQTRNILLANIRNPILVPPGGGTANANDPAETNATLWLAPGEEGRIVLRVIDEDTSNNVPVTKPNGSVEYIDPALMPSEDVSPAVQQQAVNSNAPPGTTVPPVVPPPAPPATDDTIWTSPSTPVRVNVLTNDAALYGSTKIVTAHPAGLSQSLGSSAAELVYMPTTGLLYVGSGRSLAVIDPASNHVVGKMLIDPSDPGASYGIASPRTGMVFFRMGGNGQPAATTYGIDGRPGSPTFNGPIGLPPATEAAIDNLGSTFTFALDTSGQVIYYIAGQLVGTGPGSTATSTLSAINADPASPNLGEIQWTVNLPANARAMHVAQNPATGKVYIAAVNVGGGPAQGGVFVMNPAAPAAPVKIAGTDQAISLAINPATNLVFAAGSSGSYRLNAIDAATDTLLGQLAIAGGGPPLNNAEDRLVTHHATGRVFLRAANQVFIVDGLKGSPTFNTLKATYGVGPDFSQSDLVVDQATGVVAVAGNFLQSVALVDATTDAATWLPLLPRAGGELAVDSVNQRLFFADFLNSVHTYSAASVATTSLTASLTVAPETAQVLVNPVTSRAYVASSTITSNIDIVSGAGMVGPVGGLALNKGRWGFGGRYDATNRYFFVNSGSDALGQQTRPGAMVEINGATDTASPAMPTVGQPFGLGVNQNLGQVIVAGLNGLSQTGAAEAGKIRVHDVANLASYVDVTLTGVPATNSTSISFGRHVVTDPDTNGTYVMVLGGSPISAVYLPPTTLPTAPIAQAIDLTPTFSPNDRVEVIRVIPANPSHPAYSLIYLGLFNGVTNQYNVAVLRGDTRALVGTYAGGGHSRLHTASWVAVNPSANRLYVLDYNGNQLIMLDATTLAVVASTPLPGGPSAMTINQTLNRIYVSSIASKTITAIDGATLGVISSVQLPLQAFFLHASEGDNRLYTSGGNSQDESGFMVLSDVAGQLGLPVTVTSATSGAGTTTVNPDSSVTYTPAPGFSGIDTFTYTAQTVAGNSTATVTVNVIPVAAAPVAFSDAYATAQGVTLNAGGRGVLGNDAVSNFATMLVTEVPAHGVLTPNANGSFSYAPTGPYTGPDQFKYVAVDGANSNAATVSINVVAPPPAVSPLIVVNTSDTGAGSLRNALSYANSTPGLDTITFNIPPGPMGPPYVITPMTPLPAITDPVVIAGLSQPGAGGVPSVVISGSSLPLDSNGLVVSGSGSTIRALVINNFAASGIFAGGNAILLSGDNNIVENSFIGTAVNGSAPSAVRTYTGVKITGSNNRVGGPGEAQRNVIANNYQGVWVVSGNTNVVAYNNIGANFAGTAAVPAAIGDPMIVANQFGILVDGGTGTTIGNQGASLNNVISGNGVGVLLRGGTGTVIAHSNIGLDAAGMNVIPNGEGISLYPSVFGAPTNTTIGGNTAIRMNRIAGNTGWGISLQGDLVTNTSVFNNQIGLNVANNAVANLLGGIRNAGAMGTVIGGPGRGNVISGNDGPAAFGILITGNTDGAIIQSNRIGTDINGTSARPNGPALGDNAAIFVDNGSSDVVIGGSIAAGEGNVISGNSAVGIKLWGNNNHVRGNRIGTTASGLAALPNGKYGVQVEVGSNNTVGGIGGDFRNVISGNVQGGVIVSGQGAYAGAIGTVVSANAIGVGSDLTTVVPNGGAGVDLREGTSTAVTDNLIRGNSGAGVAAWQGTTGNLIEANAIYDNGGLGIDLDNNGVDAIDAGDGDTGGNNRQNSPAISNATHNGVAASVGYDTTSFAPGSYLLRFYASSMCDPSGYGEGEQLVGSLTVGAGATGTAALSPLATPGKRITATATDASYNTSEFSACQQVTSNAVITSVSPNPSAPGFGQHLHITGTNLPGVNPADVILKFGLTDYTAQNIWHMSPTLVVARFLLPTPAGPATVRVKSPDGSIVSNAFPVTLQATPGAPVLTAVSTIAGGTGFITSATPGQTIYVSAEGIDTSGATVVFTPTSPAGPSVNGTIVSTSGGAGGTFSIWVNVPAIAPGTTFDVQVRTTVGASTSPLSNAHQMSISSAVTVVGPIGGFGGSAFPAVDCPAGSVGIGLDVRAGDDIDSISLRCGTLPSLTPLAPIFVAGNVGGGTPYSLGCAAGDIMTGVYGAPRGGGFLDYLAVRCTTPSSTTYQTGTVGLVQAGDPPQTLSCPASTAVVGLEGRSGLLIDQVSIRCQ